LRTEISFSQLQKKYSGSLGYQSGTIYYGALKPLPHALDAKFDASPSELNLKPLVLKIGGSHVLLEATVKDYSSTPIANGRYDVLIHTQDFAGLSTASTAGDIALAGTMVYRDITNQPLLKNAKLNGNLNSDGLAIKTDQAAMKIQKLSGRYELTDGNFKAEGFAFNLLNGTLKADGTVQHLDSTPQSRFHVTLAGVSLQALKSSLRSYSNQSVPVTGTIDAQADAVWRGSISNLTASSSITMRGAVIASNQSQRQQFPLNANVRVNYDGPRNLISVPIGTIQLPATTITAQGQIGNNSNLVIKAVSTNLHQLMILASGLQSSSGQQSSSTSLANVQGALTLYAGVQGTMQNPRVTAQLAATKLQVNQGQFSSLQLALAASPSEISIQNGSLNAVPRGQLQFSAKAGLHRWAYVPSAPIAASLQVRQMPLAMLDQIATKSYPITGDLNGDVQLQGSQLNPQGQGKLQITKARVQDEPIQNVVLQFNDSGGTVRSEITEGSNKASLNFTPKTKAYEIKLDVPPQELSKLHAVQARNLGVKGKVSITANGAGTVDDPKLNASVQLEQLQIRGTTLSQVKLDLNVANHNAKFALNSTGGPANLRGNGTVRLAPGYYTEASLDTSRFPLDPLLAMYMPSRPSGLTAQTELHASIRGPLTDKNKLEAHLTIPTFETKYQALELASSGPIRIDYTNSVVTLQPSGFKGTGTSFQFQGRVPLTGADKMSLTAKGSLDLRLAQMLNPDLHTGGTVALDVSAGGSLKSPGMHGQIKVQNAMFATEAAPIGIENLNATMQVSDTGVQITDAAGQLGGGQVKFGGSVIYRPQFEANLSLTGRSVRLRYPDGMRSVFDSDLTLTGNSQGSILQGRVLIDSLSFTSDFDLSNFMGQFTGTTSPPTGQSFADNLKLQVAVQSSSQLNAGNAQLGIEGQANLRIIGTASDPVVVGRTDIASGDLFFQKRQYHFEQGVINFVNPNKTEPVLNLLITTTIKQYNLSVRLTGPIEKLQTSYTSDPPLPPIDIINLIARGQTTEGAPASFGASAVLAQGLSQVESTVGSNISKLTGISGLQIDPLIGGNNTNPSARLGMQKRVTKNFVFTFSTDVTQPQNEIVQGEYQLNKRWSVSVVRNESGGFGVDGRFHTNF
jgi:translocation and assembly module TamB